MASPISITLIQPAYVIDAVGMTQTTASPAVPSLVEVWKDRDCAQGC